MSRRHRQLQRGRWRAGSTLTWLGCRRRRQEMTQFVNDDSSQAYENLVNRLLDDRRYGERWGRHWLDLARYGETSGLEGDGAIGNVWRYRDWVIDAFNSNMPYDRFRPICNSAAATNTVKTENNYAARYSGLIPTGFLRRGALGSFEPGRRRSPAELLE